MAAAVAPGPPPDGDGPLRISVLPAAAATEPRAPRDRAITLVKGQVGYHTDTGEIWRALLREQLHVKAVALACGAATLPGIVLVALGFNACLDSIPEAEVREKHAHLSGDALFYRSAVMLSTSSMMALGLVVAGRLMAAYHDAPPASWRTTATEALVFVMLAIFSLPYELFGDSNPKLAVRLVLLALVVAGVALHARELTRVTGVPGLGAGFAKVVLSIFCFFMVHQFYLLEWFVAPSTSETARLAWRCVGHIALVDVLQAFQRSFARHFPGRLPEASLPVQATGAIVFRMLGRLELALMQTPGGALAGALVAALSEVPLRATQLRRDRFYQRGRPLRAGAHRVKASSVLLDEIAEDVGTISAAAMAVAFRVGFARVADPAADAVQFALLQLALGVVADLAPLAAVLLLVRPSEAAPAEASRAAAAALSVKHATVHNINAFAKWPRRLMLTVGLVAVVSTAFAVIIVVDVKSGVFCAWSRGDGGWWHRVPCMTGADWLGV